MRFTQFLSLGLACLTTATPVPEAAPGSTHSLQERATYPSTSGLKFNIDGKVAYFAGSNSYWIGFLTNNADVDLVMSHLKASGLKVLRIWGFNDVTQTSGGVWFQSFVAGQQPVINTGANGLQRLDYVVKSAESHGIKLIINFVNNWGDYGGMLAYNNYFKTTKTTWYSDSRVQAQYQAYIKAVVSRYLTSPAIFAWELANEPRCNGCPTSVVTNWVTKTSNYIKGLDPNHMITLGDEGWLKGGGDGSYPFTTAEGVDFEANLRVANISFGTFHLYPTQWGQSNALAFGNTWIKEHGSICAKVGKPCIFEEYGIESNKPATMGPWQTTALSTSGIAADMYWQYGDTLSTGRTADDSYTIYYGSSDYKTLITDHVAAIDKKEAGSSA
ncbi:hypothetical protein ONS96_003021 [Cadophora gregata f. sp. sojae]|nr:hypothetical protein ONS96_003021 [Cadophora gregata f. sp. sojae]